MGLYSGAFAADLGADFTINRIILRLIHQPDVPSLASNEVE